MKFQSASRVFGGRIENTTGTTLRAVRVEVHLSTATEPGPTARTDLAAGRSLEAELPGVEERFDAWTAHPEVSPCAEG